MYGLLNEQKFDQHAPHCPGGVECIGLARGLTQSVAGRSRAKGVLREWRDSTRARWLRERQPDRTGLTNTALERQAEKRQKLTLAFEA